MTVSPVPGIPVDRREEKRKIGLLAFLASASMLFASFTAALLVRRTGADWQPLPMPPVLWLSSGLILASSVTFEWGRRRGRESALLGTRLLGLFFLTSQGIAIVGIVGSSGGLAGNPHASFIFVLLGVHAIHLLGGLIALGLCHLGSPRFDWVGTYWHFVGLVWFYVLLILFV